MSATTRLGDATATERIAVLQVPRPDGTPHRFAAFSVRYEAVNAGATRTDGHWDHVAIYDPDEQVHFENWLHHGGLEPGAAYTGTFDVPGLEMGDYWIRLTVDGGEAPVSIAEQFNVDGQE